MEEGPERYSRSAVTSGPPGAKPALGHLCQDARDPLTGEWTGRAEGEEETEGRLAERPACLGQVQRSRRRRTGNLGVHGYAGRQNNVTYSNTHCQSPELALEPKLSKTPSSLRAAL